MPSRCSQLADQLQNLRLDRDVERGGRLVGDQELGRAGERHRDHDALALAAGELVRIIPDPLLRGSAILTRLSISIARSRASRRLAPWCSRTVSAIWSPTVMTGLSEVIGSWKIIEISLPRMRRISSFAEAGEIRAAETDLAADDAAGAAWGAVE